MSWFSFGHVNCRMGGQPHRMGTRTCVTHHSRPSSLVGPFKAYARTHLAPDRPRYSKDSSHVTRDGLQGWVAGVYILVLGINVLKTPVRVLLVLKLVMRMPVRLMTPGHVASSGWAFGLEGPTPLKFGSVFGQSGSLSVRSWTALVASWEVLGQSWASLGDLLLPLGNRGLQSCFANGF